ncbi:MAG: HAD-IIA family hydrolase [Negativicutes bacterium]|nr:HAD-IIA family hydrolase [Negativicutes bacterium]
MIRAVVFDLDGTIYFGQTVADYARETVSGLATRGVAVRFCSNITRAGRATVGKKMRGMGFDVADEHIYTSSEAVVRYALTAGLRRVYAVGGEEFRQLIAAAGITVTDDCREAQAALVAMPSQPTWQLIEDLMVVAGRNRPIVACNRDPVYPVEGGRLKPGLGTFLAAAETACGRPVDRVVGKPSPDMLGYIAADCRVGPAEMLMVGDLLTSDVAAARAFGCRSAWVSREHSHEPDYIISDLRQILAIVEGMG